MGFEPPPNILNPGQLRGKLRTGAKTASKDQARDYLERFQRLADDPTLLVPQWKGTGADPFEPLRQRLLQAQRRRKSGFWNWWYGRSKDLAAAYMTTLKILETGKIPSFASLKFRGRDVRFIVRGRGLRDALISVQNFEDPDVRLLGYIDLARRHRVVLVSTEDAFEAYPEGTHLPPATLQALVEEEGLKVRAKDTYISCDHAQDGLHMRFLHAALGLDLRLCRNCAKKSGAYTEQRLEAHILTPKAKLELRRVVAGTPFEVHPETESATLERLVDEASKRANERAKGFEQVPDELLFDWTGEALLELLAERKEGYILVGEDLWLSDFEEAARRIGTTDLERRALSQSFKDSPPRVRTSDATINKVLEPLWASQGVQLLRELAGPDAPQRVLEDLAQQRPSDAFAALGRTLRVEERFSNYPRFSNLAPPLRFIHDAFKCFKAGDNSQLQQRIADGVKDPKWKSLTLALARAFGASTGIEWKYAPHEKDQAQYYEPYARAIAVSDPSTYADALKEFAQVLEVEAPT